MEIKEFISSTVDKLDDESLSMLMGKLVGEYVSFSFIEEDKLNKQIFEEKLADYFEKIAIKNNKQFGTFIGGFVDAWDDIVKRRIPKEPPAKKGSPTPPVPRARKYYLRAAETKESRNITVKQLADYGRIMMCLYMAPVDDEKVITQFDFSVSCLDLNKMLSSMKAEKNAGINPLKKLQFDISDAYSTDTCTFVLTMIVYAFIKSNELLGGY